MSAVDAIASVLEADREIVEVLLFEPAPTVAAQDRLAQGHRSDLLLEAGLELRGKTGLPFWDAVLVSCFGNGELAFPIVAEAAFHNSPPIWSAAVKSKHWSADEVRRVSSDMSPNGVCVFSSRVRMADNRCRHIPMLDFHCPANAQNEALATRVIRHVWPSGGFLLESGKSYHFYGKGLLEEHEVSPFLGRALLFSPIVDRAWIAHQLIEGSCGLRISTKVDGGNEPRLAIEL